MGFSKRRLAPFVIAIDGPAGAGKSTVSRLVARRLGFLYIDTGAIYRALTLKALREGIDFSNQPLLTALAGATKINLKNRPNTSLQVFLDGEDVSDKIRKPQVSKFVSEVAKIPGVRKKMLVLQRSLARISSCVLDGRDIGTVVFPNADKKFFLDADFRERVKRRYQELKAGGHKISLWDVACDLKKRDTIDSTRKCAPLRKAKDAVYLDTTNLTIREVVSKILSSISTEV